MILCVLIGALSVGWIVSPAQAGTCDHDAYAASPSAVDAPLLATPGSDDEGDPSNPKDPDESDDAGDDEN